MSSLPPINSVLKRICIACDAELIGNDCHEQEHKPKYVLCVFCKKLWHHTMIAAHEPDCRGFQRYRPIIPNYENILEQAKIRCGTQALKQASTGESQPVPKMCFCGFVAFLSHEITSHQRQTGCIKRRCRVCDSVFCSMMPCGEHRCVSLYEFLCFLLKFSCSFLF